MDVLLANIGAETAKNGPSKVLTKYAWIQIVLCVLRAAFRAIRGANRPMRVTRSFPRNTRSSEFR